MISDTLLDELNDDRDLDMENNLEYLLGLVGDTIEDETFEDDSERVKWAIAEWCTELWYIPDLRGYETGECVPKTDVPDSNGRAFCYRSDRNTSSEEADR